MHNVKLYGPQGNCPSCKGILSTVTFSCGSESGGSCIVPHQGFQCSDCHVVFRVVASMEAVANPVNVSDWDKNQ